MRRLPALALVLAACAPARGPVPSAPSPVPGAPVATAPAVPNTPETPGAPSGAAAAAGALPPDWHLRDRAADGVVGTSTTRALRELLAGVSPKRTVVVAVIDGGVDTAHAALRGALWSDPREQPNGADDDRDGLVDDVRGWNFIGGARGRSVDHERLELTRLAAACRAGQPAPAIASVGATCPQLVARLDSAQQENAAQLAQLTSIATAVDASVRTLATALGVPADSVTPARVRGLSPATAEVRQARERYQYIVAAGATPAELRTALEELQGRAKYELNPAFDPRPIVGDSVAGRPWGNGDVTGPDAGHGTHVAGIIAALAAPSDSGMRGIVPAGLVRIMSVRAVPNGDERDKDVAAAIRYAADHGAQIINMSFGKGYSPQKPAVDSAVRYAESRGVLLVHAAGNEASDNDVVGSYPTPTFLDGGRATTWIEVGASGPRAERLAARFSNFGARTVDLFAPGSDIYSTLPGGTYGRQSGTSMAAPVVTGVAALLMAYFPSLAAADVKRILLASAVRFPDARVARPGGTDAVPFASLSATGGVVNAYTAVRMAQQEATPRAQ
jgi:subtilisin family serine protease